MIDIFRAAYVAPNAKTMPAATSKSARPLRTTLLRHPNRSCVPIEWLIQLYTKPRTMCRVEAIGVAAAVVAVAVDGIVDVAPLTDIVKDMWHMMAYFFIAIVVVIVVVFFSFLSRL